jgi:hypothetical protein
LPLTLHETSIGVLSRALRNLAHVMEKGAASLAAQGKDPESLMQARLAPDMLPFPKQIQIASDNAKGCAARLAGQEPPSWPDVETSFADLQARVAKTLDYLATIGPDQIEGAEDRQILLKIGSTTTFEFTGRSYVLDFALPNVFFHVTTAYALLRAAGAEIGKRDFLGPLQ